MVTIRRKGKDNGPFRIVYGFDSISAFNWVSYPSLSANPAAIVGSAGCLADTLHTNLMAASPTNPPLLSPTPPFAPSTARCTSGLFWFNTGVAGDDCEIFRTNYGGTIAAGVASRITVYRPDLLIMFLGVNCIQHSVSDATCLSNHAAIIAEAKAQNAGLQVLVMDIMGIGENWPAGANSHDAAIDAKIADAIAPTAVGSNVTYAPLRAAFFAWQAANNPTHLALLGPLTNPDSSGLHPNYSGCRFLASTILPYFQYA